MGSNLVKSWLRKSPQGRVGTEVTSPSNCGRRKPNLRGQDGRVGKAGALGDAHVKSWDRTWSNPGFEKARRVGLVLKLRPLVTVAGVSQISFFGGFSIFHNSCL